MWNMFFFNSANIFLSDTFVSFLPKCTVMQSHVYSDCIQKQMELLRFSVGRLIRTVSDVTHLTQWVQPTYYNVLAFNGFLCWLGKTRKHLHCLPFAMPSPSKNPRERISCPLWVRLCILYIGLQLFRIRRHVPWYRKKPMADWKKQTRSKMTNYN